MELYIYEFILNFPLKSQIPHSYLQMCSVETVTKIILDLWLPWQPLFFFDKNRIRSSRLTLEPFAEKPIDNLTSISFCTDLEANRGVSGAASH